MNSENKISSFLTSVNKRGKTTDHIWGQKCKERTKHLRNTVIVKTLILPRTTQGSKTYFQKKCEFLSLKQRKILKKEAAIGLPHIFRITGLVCQISHGN